MMGADIIDSNSVESRKECPCSTQRGATSGDTAP